MAPDHGIEDESIPGTINDHLASRTLSRRSASDGTGSGDLLRALRRVPLVELATPAFHVRALNREPGAHSAQLGLQLLGRGPRVGV